MKLGVVSTGSVDLVVELIKRFELVIDFLKIWILSMLNKVRVLVAKVLTVLIGLPCHS